MTRKKVVLLLLGGVCLVGPSTSWADTIPALPSASIVQTLTLPTGSGGGGNTFGSYEIHDRGVAAAATSGYGGNDPTVMASASFSGTPGPYNFALQGDSELVYDFEVVGPASGPVPVRLVASGQATTTDSAVPLYATLDIVHCTVTGGCSQIYDVAACGNSSMFAFCNAQQFDVNTTLYLTPNLDYEVVIEANIETGSFFGPLPTGAFSASAYVDPTLQLDPRFSGQYSLMTSSNLAQTPEPGSLLLTATGACFQVAFWYKKKERYRRKVPASLQ